MARRHSLHRYAAAALFVLAPATAAFAQESGGQTVGAAPAGTAAAPAPANPQAASQRNVIIGPRDQLTVATLGEAQFSGKYVVELDGTFAMPFVGRVRAAGLTQRELAADLTTRLLQCCLTTSPQVTVDLEQTVNKKVVVTGPGVRSPGEYPYAGQMTLMNALARAGNMSDDAADEALVLRGPGNVQPGESDTIHIDLHELMAGSRKQDIELRDGDTVLVNKSDPVYVDGQAKNPGAYRVARGTTVQQLLALCGGPNDKGKTSDIVIRRMVNGKQVEIKVKDNKKETVKPGDVVTIPVRIW